MSAAEPLVSVVTPVHNGGRYLAECIDSVLSQDYSNMEYIIVNNASEDDTRSIAESYAAKDQRIRLLHTDTLLPIMKNWNYAVGQISPDSVYCKVVHADDWLHPACLREMVGVASQSPSIAIVGAYCLWRNEVTCDGLATDTTIFSGREACRLTLKRKTYPFLSPTCLLIRSECIRGEPCFYDEGFLHADVDMCYRVLRDSDFGFAHQTLTYVRWHDESVTQTLEKPWNKSSIWNIDLLMRHGKYYLSEDELQDELRSYLGNYYRRLARAERAKMDAAFWDFHRSELSKLGLRFDPGLLRKARLINLLRRIERRLQRRTPWNRNG